MKILVLHSELGVLRGGGENFTRNLCAALAGGGHRIRAVFVADGRGRYPIPLPAHIEAAPVRGWWSRQCGQAVLAALGEMLPAGRSRKRWESVQEAVSWRTIRLHNRRFRRRVEQQLRSDWHRYDLVYVHGDALLADLSARHRPTLLRLPGPVTADLAPVLKSIHAVCANGDALRRIRAFMGSAVFDLPPGIDGHVFTPGPAVLRSALGWTKEHIVFGYAGRLTPLKGVDLLAAAFRRVSAAYPNARLLLVGKGELERSVRSTLASELEHGTAHLEPDVDHSRLADCYRSMDVFVLPSRYENFSNAMLEAISCGVPVIASDVGGNPELACLAGLVFRPDSATALAECAQMAAGELPSLTKRAAMAAPLIRQRYDWSATARRVEGIALSCVDPLGAADVAAYGLH